MIHKIIHCNIINVSNFIHCNHLIAIEFDDNLCIAMHKHKTFNLVHLVALYNKSIKTNHLH